MTAPEESSGLQTLAHGQLCYLQIPAVDLWQSAEFYERIFGWRIERPYPSFEAPGLIGQWVDDRPPAPDAGPLAWINVEHIDATLELAAASGGDVLQSPSLDDGVRWLATIHDPAGNTIGVVQRGPR
jgi:predicted enzyme related to lactoylglutathione lyase